VQWSCGRTTWAEVKALLARLKPAIASSRLPKAKLLAQGALELLGAKAEAKKVSMK
jgi:hypothetical protein